MEQFFRKFQKHVILGQNGHFLAVHPHNRSLSLVQKVIVTHSVCVVGLEEKPGSSLLELHVCHATQLLDHSSLVVAEITKVIGLHLVNKRPSRLDDLW